MDKCILTGIKISRRAPRWEKKNRTCWPRKRRFRKRRKRARNRKLTPRKSPIRKRSTLKTSKAVHPPPREVADEQSSSDSIGRVSNNRISPGILNGVSTLVATRRQRLRD